MFAQWSSCCCCSHIVAVERMNVTLSSPSLQYCESSPLLSSISTLFPFNFHLSLSLSFRLCHGNQISFCHSCCYCSSCLMLLLLLGLSSVLCTMFTVGPVLSWCPFLLLFALSVRYNLSKDMFHDSFSYFSISKNTPIFTFTCHIHKRTYLST